MVPSAYVRLEALPLTPNGKVDRKALPAPDGQAYVSRGYEAPRGEVEAQLAALWADVLKVERVGRNDNFFELGGHSLLAVTLTARMRRSGLHADVRALFTSATLAELAAKVGGGTRRRRSAAEPDPGGRNGDHAGDAAAGEADAGSDRHGDSERAWWGGKRAGHLPTGAVARGDPVPPPDGAGRATRICCRACWDSRRASGSIGSSRRCRW